MSFGTPESHILGDNKNCLVKEKEESEKAVINNIFLPSAPG